MNKRIREFEQQSGIEIYGLGKDRAKWKECLEKFANLVAQDCAKCCDTYAADVLKFSQFGSNAARDCSSIIKEQFEIKND